MVSMSMREARLLHKLVSKLNGEADDLDNDEVNVLTDLVTDLERVGC
jgi:hypothetical protein